MSATATTRFYDCIVVGRSLGALASAALLARRQFRVLLLGDGTPSAYHYRGCPLLRRAFTWTAEGSPVWRTLATELALGPALRRTATALDPTLTAVGENLRLEVPPDGERFARALARELPGAREAVAARYAAISAWNEAGDALLSPERVLPPERPPEQRALAQELARLSALPPPLAGSRARAHERSSGAERYDALVAATVAFSSDLGVPPDAQPWLAAARLHGAWARGLRSYAGGEAELEALLVERFAASGGEARLAGRLAAVEEGKRGLVVWERGAEAPVGADTLLFDGSAAALAARVGEAPERVVDAAEERAVAGRFIVNLVVRTEALPAPLGEETIVTPSTPGLPVVHLQRLRRADVQPGRALLVAEVLVPLAPGARVPPAVGEGREAVLAVLREALPFLDDHLELVDSPHDGRPLWRYEGGVREEVPRSQVAGGRPREGALAEPMEPLWASGGATPTGLESGGLRGPLPGSFLVGSTVFPALGQEGRLLAARSAALLVDEAVRGGRGVRKYRWSRLSRF